MQATVRRSGCRSTRRTACTARRATSRTRGRTYTGCRPKAAADRTTAVCDPPRCVSSCSAEALGCAARAPPRRLLLHVRTRKGGPAGPPSFYINSALGTRLAIAIDEDRRARRRAHLHVVLDTAIVVRHVPVIGRVVARNVGAPLDVAAVPSAADTRTDCSTGHRTTRRRDVAAVAATDLMAEDAADHRAGNRARDVGVTDEVASLHPAALLGRTDHCTHRRHRRLEQALTVAPLVIISTGDVAAILVVPIAVADRSNRRHAVLEAHVRERAVFTRLQHDAAAVEVRILAQLPVAAVHDHGACAIVEADPVEVAHDAVGAELTAAEVVT